MKLAFFFSVICITVSLYSQKKDKPVRDYLPTENLEQKKDANKASNRPKRKNISLLYVSSADGILYGNACATQETHRMGFEYIVEPHNGLESKTGMGKFLNNTWLKTKLFSAEIVGSSLIDIEFLVAAVESYFLGRFREISHNWILGVVRIA